MTKNCYLLSGAQIHGYLFYNSVFEIFLTLKHGFELCRTTYKQTVFSIVNTIVLPNPCLVDQNAWLNPLSS